MTRQASDGIRGQLVPGSVQTTAPAQKAAEWTSADERHALPLVNDNAKRSRLADRGDDAHEFGWVLDDLTEFVDRAAGRLPLIADAAD